LDNSANHHAKAPDAPDVQRINLSNGGKNAPKFRNTIWNDQIFYMQTEDGVQKGLKTILMERGAWIDKLRLECKPNTDLQARGPGPTVLHKDVPHGPVNCCARRLLNSHADFTGKDWLTEIADENGVTIVFLPKFHCELNFIERVWSKVKNFLRRHCSFSFENLQEMLPHVLDNVITLAFFRRANRHCFRFMSGYRHPGGYHGPILDYIMKRYSSHRRIPENVDEQVQAYHELKASKSYKLSNNLK
jgi:hypothetical protein